MRLLLSVPSGFLAREILLPLQSSLEQDEDITEIVVITPVADSQALLFPNFSQKFFWVKPPTDLAAAKTLLRQQKIDFVLTPTAGLDTQDPCLLQAGLELDIPTCVFVSSWDNVFKMERLAKKGYSGAHKLRQGGLVLPNFLATWNKMNKDHLLQVFPSLAAEQVEIVGAPRFDYFARSEKIPTKAELFDYLNIKADPTKVALIHCATTELYPFAYIIKQLAEARDSQKLKKPVQLYASVHPGGDMTRHQSYQAHGAITRYSFGRRENSPHPSFTYLPTEAEIYWLVSLFKHSSVLVNQSSTVAIESMLAQVPVINVKYGQRFDWWNWYRSMVYRDFQQHYQYITSEDATRIVTSRQELIQAVNQFLVNPQLKSAEQAKTISKMISFVDGKSALRLVNFVKKCAR